MSPNPRLFNSPYSPCFNLAPAVSFFLFNQILLLAWTINAVWRLAPFPRNTPGEEKRFEKEEEEKSKQNFKMPGHVNNFTRLSCGHKRLGVLGVQTFCFTKPGPGFPQKHLSVVNSLGVSLQTGV